MSNINILIKKNYPDAQIPTQGSQFAAGWDLYAYIPEGSVEINPLMTARIDTGISIAIPNGWEGQIRPRSGLAANKNLSVLNTPGTIDSDYRGSIMVLLHNHGNRAQTIQHGDRIAQILFAPVPEVTWIETNSLSDTDRGEGGFGSTGEK